MSIHSGFIMYPTPTTFRTGMPGAILPPIHSNRPVYNNSVVQPDGNQNNFETSKRRIVFKYDQNLTQDGYDSKLTNLNKNPTVHSTGWIIDKFKKFNIDILPQHPPKTGNTAFSTPSSPVACLIEQMWGPLRMIGKSWKASRMLQFPCILTAEVVCHQKC